MKKILSILLFSLASLFTFGQKAPDHIVQITGIVVTGDSMFGLANAHIYNNITGIGTTSNQLGYFAIASKTGDSLTVRSLGYQKETFAVPNDSGDIVSLVIELSTDTLILPMVTIRKFPSEKIFKEAFLSISAPSNQYNSMSDNLNTQILRTMLATQELDASISHQYFMNLQTQHHQNSISPTTIPLIDPFAWSRFFKDLKREKEKKKKQEQEKKRNLGY